MTLPVRRLGLIAPALLSGVAAAGQVPARDHAMAEMAGMAGMAGVAVPVAPRPSPDPPPAQDMADMPGMDHAAMAGMAQGAMAGMDHAAMQGMLGRYAMTREGSGTAWQPDATPMMGLMAHSGGWMLMTEASATFVYDRQGGARGDSKAFGESMGMVMASRDLAPATRLGLRAMLSLDPAMGPRGYPLLFATGETANGRDPLVDRQHPHDLVMELAASLSQDLAPGMALSLYAGLPGEPALGPVTFMHRASGMDSPEAPISHHWFDSTHITYGVVTAGLSVGQWKIEGSAFKGREPDQHRWDIEPPKLDSWAVRAFWNPTTEVSLQLSTGHLHSPEALEAKVDEQRATASASWTRPLGERRSVAATIAWSAKELRPGPTLTAWLSEAAWRFDRNELYGRVERVRENELFEGGPLAGGIYTVNKLSLGYQREFPVARHAYLALGMLGSAYAFPAALRPDYGERGVKSVLLYGRIRFGR